MNKIKQDKILLILLFMFALLIIIATFAEFIAPFNPYEGNLKDAFIAPNSQHLFGTDKLGRDIFSRVIYGTRISMSISFLLISIIVIIGTTLGILSGYFGGLCDKLIMEISDIIISCPSMVLAIALAGVMGASVENAMLAIFVVSISKYIRLTRSLVLQIANQEYIKAAKMSGTKDIHIILRHILPNIINTIMVTAGSDIGTIILELSALSFLGFGVPAPLPELGFMINDGRSYILQAPWMIMGPSVAIFTIVSICNLLSDRLARLFN